jgi:DNA (cytosine-5)-methyltransferase 1
MTVTYGSLFAGAGGVDLGFDAAGWSCRWQVEIDPTATAVLERHWHDAARYADVCAVDGAQLEPVDVISGGFPCQDLSVAGQRAGLDGARSGLFFEFVRIVKEMRDATDGLRPRWVVWENVAGLLSTRGALATVYARWDEVGAMVQEHRLVDGRYFGVPQRRRRVIGVVGFDHRTAHGPAVLADRESVSGDSAAVGSARPSDSGVGAGSVGSGRLVADDGLVSSSSASYRFGPDAAHAQAGWLVPTTSSETSITRDDKRQQFYDTFTAFVADALTGPTRKSAERDDVYAFNGYRNHFAQFSTTVTPTLRGDNGAPAGVPQIGNITGVRRLTPRECERLMGWPDDHTRWAGPSGREIANTHRYRLCGNGVIAPMAEWIARRITATDRAVIA